VDEPRIRLNTVGHARAPCTLPAAHPVLPWNAVGWETERGQVCSSLGSVSGEWVRIPASLAHSHIGKQPLIRTRIRLRDHPLAGFVEFFCTGRFDGRDIMQTSSSVRLRWVFSNPKRTFRKAAVQVPCEGVRSSRKWRAPPTPTERTNHQFSSQKFTLPDPPKTWDLAR
jgi:hypothetical protein